jgi:hypothetical protein
MSDGWVAVATVDAMHASMIRDALAQAKIEARIEELQPIDRLGPIVRRTRVEVRVVAADEEAARAVLGGLESEAEEAALGEYERHALPEEPPRRSRLVAWLRSLFGREDSHAPRS